MGNFDICLIISKDFDLLFQSYKKSLEIIKVNSILKKKWKFILWNNENFIEKSDFDKINLKWKDEEKIRFKINNNEFFDNYYYNSEWEKNKKKMIFENVFKNSFLLKFYFENYNSDNNLFIWIKNLFGNNEEKILNQKKDYLINMVLKLSENFKLQNENLLKQLKKEKTEKEKVQFQLENLKKKVQENEEKDNKINEKFKKLNEIIKPIRRKRMCEDEHNNIISKNKKNNLKSCENVSKSRILKEKVNE